MISISPWDKAALKNTLSFHGAVASEMEEKSGIFLYFGYLKSSIIYLGVGNN